MTGVWRRKWWRRVPPEEEETSELEREVRAQIYLH
jgi:hypothetical protein